MASVQILYFYQPTFENTIVTRDEIVISNASISTLSSERFVNHSFIYLSIKKFETIKQAEDYLNEHSISPLFPTYLNNAIRRYFINPFKFSNVLDTIEANAKLANEALSYFQTSQDK